MLPCPSCDRHVRGTERVCPFCAAPLRSSPGPWSGTAAIVIAVGSMLTACGPTVTDNGEVVDAASSSSSSSTSTGIGEGSTGAGTTWSASDPTMAMTTSTGLGTSSTGGTTFVDDTLDTACGFYGGCPVDGGGVDYECNVFMEDCPQGEKCMPWANDGGEVWNASRCTPVDFDPVPVGQPCAVEGSGFTGVDDCGAEAMCFHVDPETNEGVCVEVCSGSADDPVCAEGTCIIQFDGALPLCFETCDPKAPTCAEEQVCEPTLDPADDATVCNPA